MMQVLMELPSRNGSVISVKRLSERNHVVRQPNLKSSQSFWKSYLQRTNLIEQKLSEKADIGTGRMLEKSMAGLEEMLKKHTDKYKQSKLDHSNTHMKSTETSSKVK